MKSPNIDKGEITVKEIIYSGDEHKS